MDVILPILVDPGIDDDQVSGILRERIGMDKLREVSAINWKPLPRDHGRLAALEASYTYLRRFTPKVLSTVDFHGGPGAQDLMTALSMLKELNRTCGRKVPAGAPTSFVPARYADYLAKARKAGDDTALRHADSLHRSRWRCMAARASQAATAVSVAGRIGTTGALMASRLLVR